jgi:hypothetical protein
LIGLRRLEPSVMPRNSVSTNAQNMNEFFAVEKDIQGLPGSGGAGTSSRPRSSIWKAYQAGEDDWRLKAEIAADTKSAEAQASRG